MVDPYIAAQIAARRSPSVAKTKLLSLRSNYPRGHVFAVEGDIDKAVYSHCIARLRPDLAYEFLVLKGKRQVRQLKNSLSKDLGGLSAGVFFFVDRDFDDLSGFNDTAHVFMLDRYSIENYISDPATLGRSMVTAYPCDGHPQIRRSIEDLYAKDVGDFLAVIYKLNERIYAARRVGLNIDDIMPSSANAYANIFLGNVSAIGINPSHTLPFDELSDEIMRVLAAEFSELVPAYRFRGKFIFKFFNRWLEKLADEFRQGNIGLFGVIGPQTGSIVSGELSPGSLAARSPIPYGLNDFLPAHS
jgi:hypothetical protein